MVTSQIDVHIRLDSPRQLEKGVSRRDIADTETPKCTRPIADLGLGRASSRSGLQEKEEDIGEYYL